IEVICEPGQYTAVKTAFEAADLVPEVQGIIMKALSEVELSAGDAERMEKLIDTLEGLDDVQEVFTTAILDEGA
ncbi:MAG TPA: YebC/PmpR family DNA-binding transcriptional regulator, partial [Castellaniella sp.]|nr:YebC/PmpR family DNA-binding transcriptional regulator [Castellaniella sp.]